MDPPAVFIQTNWVVTSKYEDHTRWRKVLTDQLLQSLVAGTLGIAHWSEVIAADITHTHPRHGVQ